MTEAQRARLPGPLRDIVDFDRQVEAFRRERLSATVLPIEVGDRVRWNAGVRASMREAARHLYGCVPLRGDTGPGRPTAMAA